MPLSKRAHEEWHSVRAVEDKDRIELATGLCEDLYIIWRDTGAKLNDSKIYMRRRQNDETWAVQRFTKTWSSKGENGKASSSQSPSTTVMGVVEAGTDDDAVAVETQIRKEEEREAKRRRLELANVTMDRLRRVNQRS